MKLLKSLNQTWKKFRRKIIEQKRKHNRVNYASGSTELKKIKKSFI